jgi:hypothetical protein
MFHYAGKTAKIIKTNENNTCYKLSVDNGEWDWQDWMFDPDYHPENEPLSAEDAIRAMLDGETLYDEEGRRYSFYELRGDFIRGGNRDGDVTVINKFTGLCRRPVKRKRLMTRWEILAWANSEASRGWLVSMNNGNWKLPTTFDYTCIEEDDIGYNRARLLPDLSGIDQGTVEGFEVEE